MTRKRKKKLTIPLLSALLIIVLTVIMLALLLTALLSSFDATNPEAPTEPTTSQSSRVPEPDTTTTVPQDTTTTTSTAQTQPPKPATTTAKPDNTDKPVTTPPPVTTSKPVETTPPEPEYEYHIDMSKFEDAIDPTGDLWDDAYLILVNVNHPLANNGENANEFLKNRIKFSSSTDYKFKHDSGSYLNSVAMKALAAMFLEAEAQGIAPLEQTSAHRSYSYQSSLFNNNCNKTKHWLCECGHDWIHKNSKCELCGKTAKETLSITREEQEESVSTYSCAPGTSEHQTGLAVDIIIRGVDTLEESFGETEAGKWLAENAHHFGFVLRFPPDKEHITGIIYEPWHFRYVGRTHATAMYEMNFCLEEYVEYLDSIDYFN